MDSSTESVFQPEIRGNPPRELLRVLSITSRTAWAPLYPIPTVSRLALKPLIPALGRKAAWFYPSLPTSGSQHKCSLMTAINSRRFWNECLKSLKNPVKPQTSPRQIRV